MCHKTSRTIAYLIHWFVSITIDRKTGIDRYRESDFGRGIKKKKTESQNYAEEVC